MSARKKVNQSRPRALTRAAASRVAGDGCFDAADDTKPPPTRRSSRPPSNSSAKADSSMSPAPSGIYGVGFRPSAPCNRPPLFDSPPRRTGSHARLRAAVVLVPSQSRQRRQFWEAACEFHGTRYYEGRGLGERAGLSDQVPGRRRYGTFVREVPLAARNAPAASLG